MPANGNIFAARTFDAGASGTNVRFQIWRLGSGTYTIIYQSDPVQLTNSRKVLSFVLPSPIPVLAGYTLGLSASANAECAYGGASDDEIKDFLGTATANMTYSDPPAQTLRNYRVNVEADFIAT